jgi:hypothetical protein
MVANTEVVAELDAVLPSDITKYLPGVPCPSE